jgi:2-succinyl-5-enolpyruvyl-6-hydroxy-3-cyclohexene-1-carboxylate synthase
LNLCQYPEYNEFFKDNFLTPLNLDFKKFVEGYKGTFSRIKSWKELGIQLSRRAVKSKRLTVLEAQNRCSKIQTVPAKILACSSR